MTNILVSGRMASGKDVFADYLVSHHGFVKTAFADGIRRTIKQFNPDYKLKSNRALEIDVGNTFRQWFGDDVWIREALANLSVGMTEMDVTYENGWYRTKPRYAGCVISDGRFPMEYEVCVKQRGFIHVHIEADASIRKQRLLERDHTFNRELFESPADCQIPITDDTIVLTNNGTLDEFYRQIDELIVKLEAVT